MSACSVGSDLMGHRLSVGVFFSRCLQSCLQFFATDALFIWVCIDAMFSSGLWFREALMLGIGSKCLCSFHPLKLRPQTNQQNSSLYDTIPLRAGKLSLVAMTTWTKYDHHYLIVSLSEGRLSVSRKVTRRSFDISN